MRRRDLLALVAGAALSPLAARAQQKPMPVIGLLGISPDYRIFRTAFRQGLGEAGYVEGQNVAFEYRVAQGAYDRIPGLAAELADLRVNMIVAGGGTPWALAAKNATSTIPIVFMYVGDPVGIGFVASLAHPGGNLTGFTNISTELTSKQLQLLSELVPRTGLMAALLVNPSSANARLLIRGVQEAARLGGIKLTVLNASTESEVDAAFASLLELHADVLIVDPDAFLTRRSKQIAALALLHAIPAIYSHRDCVVDGGLISYGIAPEPVFRQVGVYAGRILKGEKPADLPVEQPTKLELVINLKTAEALGLTVPQSILARADEVIE
jgi:putative ABC transport system substrate-binding protein